MLAEYDWSNKKDTGERVCSCGTWKEHWLNFSYKIWPTQCSVEGCSNPATLGAHVINSSVKGGNIIPMCSSCNGLSSSFTLKDNTKPVSANTSVTCG